MDLELSDVQQTLLETTRRFLDSVMPSNEIRAIADEQRLLSREYWSQAANLGWTAMLIPEELGGGGISDRPLMDLALVAEEIGAHTAPGPIGAVNAAATCIVRSGREEHHEFLGSVADGSQIVVWAQSEGKQSWDGAPRTVTAKQRDGGWVLSGSKEAVECALEADYFLVPALTDEGPSQFLVPANAAGLVRQSQSALDASRRFGRIELHQVLVPASSLVGAEGGAAEDIECALLVLLALQCADAVGATSRCFNLVMEWVRHRYTFGRPIGSYQAIKHRLADHKLWLEVGLAASSGLIRAVADESPNAAQLASAAKSVIAESSLRIIQDCIQIFGGIGVTWEHEAHLLLRRATTSAALVGTISQHRERLCALVAA